MFAGGGGRICASADVVEGECEGERREEEGRGMWVSGRAARCLVLLLLLGPQREFLGLEGAG